jgi:hypothetical protein
MKTIYKIIFTILIVIIGGFLVLLGVAVASSPHHISSTSRSVAINTAIAAMILGPIGIVVVWLSRKRKPEVENDIVKFDERKYANEMASMIYKAIAILHIEHPAFELYTVHITTNPKELISSISIDNKENSDEKQNSINTADKKNVPPTRNYNPYDFKLKELYHIKNNSFKDGWSLHSEDECWNTLQSAMKKLGDRFYDEFKKLRIHPDFELTMNGKQHANEFTWSKQDKF